MDEPDPGRADYVAVSRLYGDWNPRQRSKENPLTPDERVGYLVVDYWIRLHMGAYDGIIYDEQREIVSALRTVNLEVQAQALEHALKYPSEWQREQAVSEIARSLPGSFDVLLHNAVAAYLRRIGQGHKLIAND